MNELEAGMRWFVRDKKALESLSIAFGNKDTAAFFYENADRQSLYDLASLTKLFTLIAIMQLSEAGKLKLSACVSDYDRRFKYISDVSILQLMGYHVNIVTASRIDEAINNKTAQELLFCARAIPYTTTRFYSDMHAMVLKYIVESASGMSFYEYLQASLLKPLHMTQTYATIPIKEIPFTQSYDREHRIEGSRYLVRRCPIGSPHDPKAALLSPNGSDLCGHAGLFSTLNDMAALCRGLLSGDVLLPRSLEAIAQNRTGQPLTSGGFTQYLGYLCFVKHPDQYFSEIPAYMSHQAFGFSGFTGNHLSVDPGTGTFNVFLGNRCLDRLTMIKPDTPECLTKHGLAADGTGLCRWQDGEDVPSSVQYVHQKDRRLHQPIETMRIHNGEMPFVTKQVCHKKGLPKGRFDKETVSS